MIFKVSKSVGKENFLCQLRIEHIHNHPVKSLQATSFNSISMETKEKLFSLFKSGMSAAQAYSEFLQN